MAAEHIEELRDSELKNIDKLVELVYRNCDCSFCEVTGTKCPYKDIDPDLEENLNAIDNTVCKKAIKEIILKAAKEEE